jgi:Mn2+/Fe2+ NRAMP family transporter
LLAQNEKIMGKFTVTGWLKWLAWLATLVMGIAAVVMFATWGK